MAALSVAIGAFGAHGLKKILEETGKLETFETAVKYQFYHVFGIIIIGLILKHYQDSLLTWAGFLMLGGIVIFSGSLYILSLSGVKWWGAVTPIGGVLFVVAWVMLGWSVWKSGL